MVVPALDWDFIEPPAGSAANDETGDDNSRQPAPPTILVVEDEILIRAAVCDYLRHWGYRVLEAATGEEGQTILNGSDPVDILLSDVQLGSGINGFALASWVRKHHPGVRIVLASGVEKLSKEAGDLCDGPLLTKPFSHSTLAAQIRAVLAKAGRRAG